MSRILNIPKNLPEWPKDWMFHILNTLDLYFDSTKIVSFDDAMTVMKPVTVYSTSNLLDISGNEEALKTARDYYANQELYSMGLKLFFSINGFKYIVDLSYAGDNKVHVDLFFITTDKSYISDEDLVTLKQKYPEMNFCTVIPVGTGYEEKAWNIADNLDKYITEDYNRRKDKGNDDWRESDPIQPPDPVDSLDLSPVGSLS